MPQIGDIMSKIREYVDELFEKAPRTKQALDLKEEIIVNAEEKFSDLVADGYRDEDAFGVVIHSIGNVEELFKELEPNVSEQSNPVMDEKNKKKKALYTAIAVGIYIFAGAVFFFFVMMDDAMMYTGKFDLTFMGLIVAALICIPPTIMLVYSSMLNPQYKKTEDNIVEDYKEWKSGNAKDKEVRKAISSIIWTVTVIIYFLISFNTMAWHITWIIFLIAGCIESIVRLMYSIKS